MHALSSIKFETKKINMSATSSYLDLIEEKIKSLELDAMTTKPTNFNEKTDFSTEMKRAQKVSKKIIKYQRDGRGTKIIIKKKSKCVCGNCGNNPLKL